MQARAARARSTVLAVRRKMEKMALWTMTPTKRRKRDATGRTPPASLWGHSHPSPTRRSRDDGDGKEFGRGSNRKAWCSPPPLLALRWGVVVGGVDFSFSFSFFQRRRRRREAAPFHLSCTFGMTRLPPPPPPSRQCHGGHLHLSAATLLSPVRSERRHSGREAP